MKERVDRRRRHPCLRRWLAATVAVGMVGCATRSFEPEVTLEEGLREVRRLIECGSYSCLASAFLVGQDMREVAPERGEVRDTLGEIAALLAIRERQLAILGDRYLAELEALVATCGECPRLRALSEIAAVAPVMGAGVISDDVIERAAAAYHVASINGARWVGLLAPDLRDDASSAAFYLTLRWYLRDIPRPIESQELVKIHADSALVRFAAGPALLPQQALLTQEALAIEPSFVEAHIVLGLNDLADRRLGPAEVHLREAIAVFPESVSTQLGLADILFALEEHSAALERYEDVLTLAPEHRDALLRKGIALSALERSSAAIAALDRILELGTYNLGEAHYWLAWNRYALGESAAAWDAVEEAERSLEADIRPHALAGQIALARARIGTAEGRFKSVVASGEQAPDQYAGHDALCESTFSLARIEHERKDPLSAARHFEAAARCREIAAAALAAAIERIREQSLSAERKAAVLLRKRHQRDVELLKRAAGLYNAAVSHATLGRATEALQLAREAAEHHDYQVKTSALIEALGNSVAAAETSSPSE